MHLCACVRVCVCVCECVCVCVCVHPLRVYLPYPPSSSSPSHLIIHACLTRRVAIVVGKAHIRGERARYTRVPPEHHAGIRAWLEEGGKGGVRGVEIEGVGGSQLTGTLGFLELL